MIIGNSTEYISPAGQQDKDHFKVSQNFPHDPSKSPASPPTIFDPKVEHSALTSAQKTNDQGNHSRRASKTSTSGKQRDGSISSNKRSIQGQPLLATSVLQSATTNPPAVVKSEKKRSGISRLFSKLNCCGVPEDPNAIDLDEQVIPARKPSKPVPSQARQTTPPSKPNISAAESSTTGSKEPNEEKIGGPPYSSLKSAGAPTIQEQQISAVSKTTPTSESGLLGNAEDQNTHQIAPEITSPGSILPPMEVPSQDMRMDIPQQTTSGPQDESVTVSPTPTVLILAEQRNAINVQTPLQNAGDSDTEMVDAPPIQPETENMQKNVEISEAETVPQLPPPPPPPIVPRTENSPPGHDRNLSNNVPTPNEQQKWLLPPMKPEFRGKKCLVLDLDETLVHSSFKVGTVLLDRSITRLTIIDTPPS